MVSQNKTGVSIEDIYKLLTEEPPKNPNDWQSKSIRILALNHLLILQKLDKLDFRVKMMLYLFTGMFVLLFATLINLTFRG